jgi:hypothetical protein
MNVYSLVADANKYQNLVFVNTDDDWKVIYQFNGTSIGSAWRPRSVEVLYDEDHAEDRPRSDFPSLFGHLPVFSRRAVEVLESLLKENGELLPLDCKDGDYFVFNVTRVVDALDEAHSELVRFSDGKIMDIKRFIFQADRLTDIDIFKLPQMPLGKIFVTDKFVRVVQEAGLTGFAFELVWTAPNLARSAR